jgi:hypothetical protein
MFDSARPLSPTAGPYGERPSEARKAHDLLQTGLWDVFHTALMRLYRR